MVTENKSGGLEELTDESPNGTVIADNGTLSGGGVDGEGAAPERYEGPGAQHVFYIDGVPHVPFNAIFVQEDWNVRDYDDPDTIEHIEYLFDRCFVQGEGWRELWRGVYDADIDKFRTTEGHCRYKATQRAIEMELADDFFPVPMRFESATASETELVKTMLISNSGKSLSPFEMARAFFRLATVHGVPLEEIGTMVSPRLTKQSVDNHLLLSYATPKTQDLMRQKVVQATTVINELRAADADLPTAKAEIAEKVLVESWAVAQTSGYKRVTGDIAKQVREAMRTQEATDVETGQTNLLDVTGDDAVTVGGTGDTSVDGVTVTAGGSTVDDKTATAAGAKTGAKPAPKATSKKPQPIQIRKRSRAEYELGLELRDAMLKCWPDIIAKPAPSGDDMIITMSKTDFNEIDGLVLGTGKPDAGKKATKEPAAAKKSAKKDNSGQTTLDGAKPANGGKSGANKPAAKAPAAKPAAKPTPKPASKPAPKANFRPEKGAAKSSKTKAKK